MPALGRHVMISLSIFAMCATNAFAIQSQTFRSASLPVAEAAKIREDKPQPTPIGYVMFCINYAAQCGSTAGRRRIGLNENTWKLINAVNMEVNQRIAADEAKGTVDWSLTTRTGNCNDYAVQKRDALIKQGFPRSALSLAAVVTRRNEGHLILTVRTDHGDFVLDNLRNSVVGWNHTGYRWVSVQSNSNPNTWVRVLSAS